MNIRPTALGGVLVVSPTVNADERGLFARTYDAASFAAAGLPTSWPQCNTSWNARKGTLRWLHYQAEPRPDPKLVSGQSRCINDPFRLRQRLLTLKDDCEVFNMMAEVYVPELARGVRWNDGVCDRLAG